MRMISICFLACIIATAARGQHAPSQPAASPGDAPMRGSYDPALSQPQGMTLAQKCAMASELLKSGNCGPQGCDIGLCVALQNGCRINHWGYTCPWPSRQVR
jgi:hypothetical protein